MIVSTVGAATAASLAGHFTGLDLQAANPDGMLIYTPAAGYDPPLEPAYPIGFFLAAMPTILALFVAAVIVYVTTRLLWPTYRKFAGQVLLGITAGGILTGVVYGVIGQAFS